MAEKLINKDSFNCNFVNDICYVRIYFNFEYLFLLELKINISTEFKTGDNDLDLLYNFLQHA